MQFSLPEYFNLTPWHSMTYNLIYISLPFMPIFIVAPKLGNYGPAWRNSTLYFFKCFWVESKGEGGDNGNCMRFRGLWKLFFFLNCHFSHFFEKNLFYSCPHLLYYNSPISLQFYVLLLKKSFGELFFHKYFVSEFWSRKWNVWKIKTLNKTQERNKNSGYRRLRNCRQLVICYKPCFLCYKTICYKKTIQ